MPADANFSFMARQLALSDFPAGEAEEIEGGLLLKAGSGYIATWDPARIEDKDAFVEAVGTGAGEIGICRWLLISPPAAPAGDHHASLEDSLFLYGMHKADFEDTGIPDNIQVLGKPQFSIAPAGTALSDTEPGNQQLFALISQGNQSADQLGYSIAGMTESPVSTLQFALASQADAAVGAIAWRVCGALSRIAWIWVEPGARGNGIGSALAAHAVISSQAAGALISTAWTGKKGSLRYFFSRLGYEDKVRVQTFLPD